MENKKRNTIITCIIVGLIVIIGTLYFLLNNSVVDSGLSVLEKKWLTDHINQVIDVRVYNDVPVYGYNGSGINFDFLDYFTDKYKISFNKISYYTTSTMDKSDFGFLLLNPYEKMDNHDILFDTDHYAIVSNQKEKFTSLDAIQKIGFLKSDVSYLEGYFSSDKVVLYDDIKTLFLALKQNDVGYVCVPILANMDRILRDNNLIVMHLDDVKKQYVLRITDDTIYHILRKTYIDYKKKDYIEDYSKNYLNVYFNSTNTSDLARKNYNAKVYHYGYVVNMPFENIESDKFVGTLSNYITNFQDISFSEIDSIQYQSIDDLKSALVSGEVDFALGNFDYDNFNLKYVTSAPIRDIEYYVLGQNQETIHSLRGLRDKRVSVVSGSKLWDLCKQYEVPVDSYANTDELLRGISDSSIILVDRETYFYYKDSKLKNYKVILNDSIPFGYRFILNEKNTTFNELFQYYVSSVSYHDYMYQYRTSVDLENNDSIIKIILFSIVFVSFLIVTVIFISRKSISVAISKRDDRLKYIDPLTSLKNRSYLNKNIYTWDDNVIFPQSIIVIDLDHIKKVNDKFGREAGDEIIKKVAGILIDHQLENTDIIRSDGDEFIIYMVGYDEKQVCEHMNKLLKLMRDIPKMIGVSAGYSMIYDEVKTIDDAINEAILMLMDKKEKK